MDIPIKRIAVIFDDKMNLGPNGIEDYQSVSSCLYMGEDYMDYDFNARKYAKYRVPLGSTDGRDVEVYREDGHFVVNILGDNRKMIGFGYYDKVYGFKGGVLTPWEKMGEDKE